MTERSNAETDLEPRFDPETGLLPAVVQDVETGRVRMLGYMSRASLERTRRTGRVTFYSRSRDELWEKGRTSGNWLEAQAIELDCDGDALLVRAVAHGPTCHTGRESCFDGPRLWEAEAGEGEPDGQAPAGDESATPAAGEAAALAAILAELRGVVAARDRERPEDSYTVRLLEGGPRAAGRKVAEEALEVALAATAERERVDEESADLLYHLLVLWQSLGLETGDVARVLRRRRSPSDGDRTSHGTEEPGSARPEDGEDPA